jgi:Rod binding domain-containing protein|tara:strand:- start:709 stop:1161 length:453 start_codon:yes stop_codon:yes gene_type:complete
VTDVTLSAKSYLDFAGLGELRTRAKNHDEDAAQEVGRQFEAMFVQMVFKSMREANVPLKSDLMSSSSIDTFEQMYHEELSQVMAQKGLFGLGDWLTDQVKTQSKNVKAVDAYRQLNGQTEAQSLPLQSTISAQPLPLNPERNQAPKGIKL